MGLVPLETTFEIVFDTEFAEGLDDLFADSRTRPLKVGTAVLHSSADYPGLDEFGERISNFGPGKLEESAVVERALAVLRQAKDVGVEILVYPECFACSRGVLNKLKEAYWADTASVRLLIPGSLHEPSGNGWRNNSYQWCSVAEQEPPPHHKFSRFSVGEQFEDIECHPRRIAVYACANWSFSTLICRDFLDDEARQLLGQLAVTLVVVPAHSPKSCLFGTLASSLTQTSQSFIVVANNPFDDTVGGQEPHGIFGVPAVGQPILATFCLATRYGGTRLTRPLRCSTRRITSTNVATTTRQTALVRSETR